jgi:hypothetical protein
MARRWSRITAMEHIEQRVPWWRDLWAVITRRPRRTEPRTFFAEAFIAGGPARISIIDRGPDMGPGVSVAPLNSQMVLVDRTRLEKHLR